MYRSKHEADRARIASLEQQLVEAREAMEEGGVTPPLSPEERDRRVVRALWQALIVFAVVVGISVTVYIFRGPELPDAGEAHCTGTGAPTRRTARASPRSCSSSPRHARR